MVLISTSPATPGDRDLPSPTNAFQRFVSTANVDRSDRASVLEYLVGYCRVLAGHVRPFDEARLRELVRRDVERARDFAAARNHELLAEGTSSAKLLSAMTTPTLVVHGTADPMSPSSTARRSLTRSPARGC